jgi:hypothetical protein
VSTLRAELGIVRRKSRHLARKASTQANPLARAALRAARRLPVSPAIRAGVSRSVLRRRKQVKVPIEKLLLGPQNSRDWSATDFAHQTGWLLWGSTRVVDGPHVALLRLAAEHGPEGLTDEEILKSEYGRMANACIENQGRYFSATDAPGVITLARAFIGQNRRTESGPGTAAASAATDPILVAPIRGSGCYQVIDGHHRIAVAVVQGRRTMDVTVKRVSVTTPLQDLLSQMSWIGGERELYQPVDSPELKDSWTTVRRCSDRLEKMSTFLAERGLLPPATTYLDLASCYGWFVAQMNALGYRAEGVERDPLAPTVAQFAYGLDPDLIRTGTCEEVLVQMGDRVDVVSCFSLLHHFVLGRGSISAEALLRGIDRVTGRVLFIDTGQEHEAWFHESLKGWNPERIVAFLQANTTFDEIVDLGPDSDAVRPYHENYGRHLFACVRKG